MELNIRISLDNVAFESKYETARCLSRVSAEILDTPGERHENSSGIVRDVNGNSVGEWHIIE